MNRRAKLEADVRYTQRKVSSGQGGAVKSRQDLATVNQISYLRRLGMKCNLDKITKAQAGRMINQLKNQNLSPEHVEKINRIGQPPREKSEPSRLSLDQINSLFMEATWQR